MKIEEQELIDLISRYLDGALSEADTHRLLELVRGDPDAADRLRDLAFQHVQLRRIYREKERAAPQRGAGTASFSGRFTPVRRALALAAVLLVMAACAFWLAGFALKRAAGDLTVSLLDASGDLTEATDPQAAPDGTAVVAPPDAIQLLRFKDGTIVQLAPGSAAEIIDDGVEGDGQSCKVIRLASGMLMADIARQPSDFPLKIITPHAEIIVAGTRFTCKVEADHTHIRMHDGWAHVVNAFNGAKAKLISGHHITIGERFHFGIRKMHEKAH